MTYKELALLFREREKEIASKKTGEEAPCHIVADITFTKDSFTKPYSLASRTYRVTSDNKAYRPNMIGYSIFGSALDGTDQGVRLDQYIKDETGNQLDWTVEDCKIISGL